MNSILRLGMKTRRLYLLLAAIVAYVILFIVNADHTFTHYTTTPPTIIWSSFGISTFTALMFFSVGAFVWLYTSSRAVAFALFGLSFSMVLTFLSETSLLAGDYFLQSLSTYGSIFGVFFLTLLLLLFPKNYLAVPSSKNPFLQPEKQTGRVVLLVRLYCIVFFLSSVSLVFLFSISYIFSPTLPSWLFFFGNIYTIVGLTGALITIIISYRQTLSRERQQLRLFVGGVVLTIVPFLVLSLLPQALGLPDQYVIAPSLSTLTILIFPVSLGYSILRYQVLLFDAYIRRVASWIVGTIFLLILGYFIVWLSSMVLAAKPSLYAAFVAGITAILAPVSWWLAKVCTERFFFSEIQQYRRLIEKPSLLADTPLDLKEATQVFTLAAMQAFETSEACLFVFDEESGQFLPPGDLSAALAQHHLAYRFVEKLSSLNDGTHQNTHAAQHLLALEVRHPTIQRLSASRRPLLLSEITRAAHEQPTGLGRYLNTSTANTPDALIAPVRSQGKLIGILVLGERGDRQQYAGPDFDIVQLILDRFSPVLETARLYERAQRHASLLNSLYRASTTPGNVFQSLDEIAITYTHIASKATSAGAEIWLCDETQHALHRVTMRGDYAFTKQLPAFYASQKEDWLPWFYEGESYRLDHIDYNTAAVGPPCMLQLPSHPFVWLPLLTGTRHLGVLVLLYSRPHIFTKEEMSVLELFASQCSAALENARIAIELRAAYERQKELDVLKDQFIMTASHELRTPLTAVQGYLELLEQYNKTLSSEARANFITRANHGCEELSLMVENIMDANRVHVDVEHVQVTPVLLRDSVMHVLEIMETLIKSENRTATVEIDPNMIVLADDHRLRQILLNLVGNALKYSEAGTPIEISARSHEQQYITLSLRDHGLGVPPQDQERIFERFVRLERDMNSPIRGAGLGLHISKRLIEAMGGNIWVESNGQGDGSIFHFTLQVVAEDRPLPHIESPQSHVPMI